jgi:hypothetical protein
MKSALVEQGSNDYMLRKNEESVWIGVDRLAVYIKRDSNGVEVQIFKSGKEMDPPVAVTWASNGKNRRAV